MKIYLTAAAEDAGGRLDVFLASRTELSRSRIRKLIDAGLVICAGGLPVKPSRPVEAGETFLIDVPEMEPPRFVAEDIPLDIRYEDKDLLVVNKPPGMVVHPGRGNWSGTLAGALAFHCESLSHVGGPLRPGIVHRLDKDTSGLLVVALNDRVHRKLADMIRDRTLSRIYTAFVWGHPDPDTGVVEAPVGRHPKQPTRKAVVTDGRSAATEYTMLTRYTFLSKMELRLRTGRTHQIRVHMAHIGHHVFGDPDYGGREERLKGFHPDVRVRAVRLLSQLPRQALHASRLSFPHPVSGETIDIASPLPEDIGRLEMELATGI